MYCKNCGKELKPGAAFCPGCGAKQEGVGEKSAPAKAHFPARNPSAPLKFAALSFFQAVKDGGSVKGLPARGIAGAAVLAAAVFIAFGRGPSAGSLAEDYFSEIQSGGGSAQDWYGPCFDFAVSDFLVAVKDEAANGLSDLGLNTSGFQSRAVNSLIRGLSAGAVEDGAAAEKLGQAVAALSQFEVTGSRREGKERVVEVEVSGPDLAAANRKLLKEVSPEELASIAAGLAVQDASGYVDALIGAADGTERISAQGEIPFQKEDGEWLPAREPEGLMEAYFGISESADAG